jgi:hypothetical protein
MRTSKWLNITVLQAVQCPPWMDSLDDGAIVPGSPVCMYWGGRGCPKEYLREKKPAVGLALAFLITAPLGGA